MIGTRLANRYELLERIGGGGMSVVYRAQDTLLNRVVAVKVLRAEYASDDDVVRRLIREAQAAASLSHPNIVSIYDVGGEGDIHFIVMEYVSGKTLKELIQKSGRLPLPQVLDITIQICEALEHAHAHRVIHRDIKPHNILLTPTAKVRVADFGIARAATASTLTHSGAIIGSVHYFSPEQAKGGFTGEKSDLYSLGIVMYEMLVGRPPFDGDGAITVALKHIQQTPIPPSKINPDVAPAVERIVMKALEKDQLERYQSAAEMLQDLAVLAKPRDAAIVSNASARGTHSGREVQEKPALSRTPRQARDRDAKPRPKKRKSWSIVLLFVALAALLGFRALSGFFNVPLVEVPDVKGKSLTEAQRLLSEKELVPFVVAETFDEDSLVGQIISQQPEAEQTVKAGRTINLVVSKGPEFTVVPQIENIPIREAGIRLNSAGLELGSVRPANHPTVPKDSVISQNPRSGTSVTKGTLVDVEVSTGLQLISVVLPDFSGDTLEEAHTRIMGLKLSMGTVRQQPSPADANTVIDQEPVAGSEMKEGSQVNLIISSGTLTSGRSTVHFRVPGESDEVSVKAVLTDGLGSRSIYDARHAPNTMLSLVVEWAGSEARVCFFVDDIAVDEEVLR